MSFKLWESIRKKEELYNTCKEIQENVLDDYFNFDDSSVGIYSVGRIDESLVKELNEECEGCKIVSWDNNSFMLQVDTKEENVKHLLVIKIDEYSENWEIKNAFIKRNYNY
jgi:hypothetical protein